VRSRLRKLALPALLLLPVLVVGVALGVSYLRKDSRMDPAYFGADYSSRYDVPAAAAEALERAFQTGDVQLMRELVATRADPAEFQTRPGLGLYDLRGRDGEYYNYLYTTADNRDRSLAHIKFVNGRYVVVEENLDYLVDSGKWPQAFAPLTVTYYVLLLLALGVIRISRGRRSRRPFPIEQLPETNHGR